MKVLLEATNGLLKKYGEKIIEWRVILADKRKNKILMATHWLGWEAFGLNKTEISKIRSTIKFPYILTFIDRTADIVTTGIGQSMILKKAKGKFVPWSEAKKEWYFLRIVLTKYNSL